MQEGVYAADRIRCGAVADALPAFSFGQLLDQHSRLQVATLPFELLPTGDAAPPDSHTSQLLYLRLTGRPPSWLGSLQQLVVLDISSSQTLSQLPDSLGSLQNLQVFVLCGCGNLLKLP